MVGWTAVTLRKEVDHSIKEEIRPELGEHDEIRAEAEGDVRIVLKGYYRHQDAVKIIRRVSDYLKDLNVVLDANNTTDSGDGTVYKVYEDDVVPIEIFEGEETEVGRDVAFKIENQFGFRPVRR